MKKIYEHPTLAGLSRDEREEVWYAFRDKYPNLAWGLTFFVLWAVWALTWMIVAQVVDPYLRDSLALRLFLHVICTLGIGVIGGVMLFGYFMLPNRMREFHNYLDTRSLDSVKDDLKI